MDQNGTTRLEPAPADARLSGRIAVVTGASRGLGQAIAVRLARAGAAVAVTARTSAALAATVRQLDELGVTSLAVTLEVRDGDSIRAAVEAIEGRLGQTLADPEVRAYWTDRIPLGRVALPEDVSEAVLYLASPAADFITGTVLAVDGGLTMR